MKTIKLTVIFLIFTCKLYSQGMNNDFDYDKEDLNIIFRELGVNMSKFPIQQNANQFMDIIIEEYENKELIKRISVIDATKKLFEPHGINALSYFKPEKDSVYMHRFYFFKNDSTIKIKLQSQNMVTGEDFNFKGKSLYYINTDSNISSEIRDNQYIKITDEPKMLLYLYANSLEDKDKPLWCPAGLSKEELLKRFYYLIFISIQPLDYIE